VIVVMGSAAETVEETVEHLVARGEKVGLLKLRLFRPLATDALAGRDPGQRQSRIAVLDRCKEPGAERRAALQGRDDGLRRSRRRWPPPDAAHHRRALRAGQQGIHPGHGGRPCSTSCCRPSAQAPVHGGHRGRRDPPVAGLGRRLPLGRLAALQHAVFWGLGADGTVSANKNSIKIVGESTRSQAQGYFVYDSKKSGAVTVSHLRFGEPTSAPATWWRRAWPALWPATRPVFVERYDLLAHAAPGGVFLLNTPEAPDAVWASLPAAMRAGILSKKGLKLWVIDAYAVAQDAGMGRRINTIMQTCFFAISGILPRDEAIAAIKKAVDKTYGKKSKRLADLNHRAIDVTLANLHEVSLAGLRI
jgi:pyruvate-ferredoxin/flavodoxin oxidoreductase